MQARLGERIGHRDLEPEADLARLLRVSRLKRLEPGEDRRRPENAEARDSEPGEIGRQRATRPPAGDTKTRATLIQKMEDKLGLGPEPGPGRSDLHAAGEPASSAYLFFCLFNGFTTNAVSNSGWRAI